MVFIEDTAYAIFIEAVEPSADRPTMAIGVEEPNDGPRADTESVGIDKPFKGGLEYGGGLAGVRMLMT